MVYEQVNSYSQLAINSYYYDSAAGIVWVHMESASTSYVPFIYLEQIIITYHFYSYDYYYNIPVLSNAVAFSISVTGCGDTCSYPNNKNSSKRSQRAFSTFYLFLFLFVILILLHLFLKLSIYSPKSTPSGAAPSGKPFNLCVSSGATIGSVKSYSQKSSDGTPPSSFLSSVLFTCFALSDNII